MRVEALNQLLIQDLHHRQHREIFLGNAEPRCQNHPNKALELYCTRCREIVCVVCSLWGAHYIHDVKAAGKMTEADKADVTTLVGPPLTSIIRM